MFGIRFEVYEDEKRPGEWRWRCKSAGNNRTLADSGEGYINQKDCIDALTLIKNLAKDAPVATLPKTNTHTLAQVLMRPRTLAEGG
jgi:uncharacterized protein YegP (UPF0339 family)